MRGTATFQGLSLEDAETWVDVVAAAVVDACGLDAETARVTATFASFDDSDRRRRLSDGVVATYDASVLEAHGAAAIEAVEDLTADDLDASLEDVAPTMYAESVFDAVTTSDVEYVGTWDATQSPVPAPTFRPTPAPSERPTAKPTTPKPSVYDDGNDCAYARDGVCDEPRYCAYGTDTYDCTMPTPRPTRKSQRAGSPADAEDDGLADDADAGLPLARLSPLAFALVLALLSA